MVEGPRRSKYEGMCHLPGGRGEVAHVQEKRKSERAKTASGGEVRVWLGVRMDVELVHLCILVP